MSSIPSETVPCVEQISRYEHDRLLLQKFVATRSDEAFAALFHRYHAFVYSVCMREVRDPELAADAAQIVFIALTRKAAAIRRGTALSAWLFQAACYAARDLARKERCRMAHEQSAVDEQVYRQNQQNEGWEEEAWRKADPVLNDALGRLNSAERLVILLRYFDGLSLKECAQALDLTVDGARMRIGRALNKMRRHLQRSGVALTAAALAALLSRHAAATTIATVTAPSLSGFAPPLHLQAAKGVLFKMNVLLWKPVVVSVVGACAALSLPVIAPHAVPAFHAIAGTQGHASYTTQTQSQPYAPAMASGDLVTDLFAVVAGDAHPQFVAVSKRQQEGSAPRRLRSASPADAAGRLTGQVVLDGFEALSLRHSVPVVMLPPEAQALLQQLAAQTVDEDASSRTKQILNSLRSLQKTYTTSGRLDEAVTVREAIADFKLRMAGVLADPGNLTSYRENVGRSYLFAVVGSTIASASKTELLLDLGRTMQEDRLLSEKAGAASLFITRDRLSIAARPESTLDISRLGVVQEDEAMRNSLVLSRPASAAIWGTDIYTDDSPLSAVAVHAGLLSEGQKGVLKVTIFAGRDEYEGSTRNGIVSSGYGSWDGSYMVEKAPGFDAAKPTPLPTEARTLLATLGTPASAGEELFSQTLDSLRKLRTKAEQAAKLDEALVLRDAVALLVAHRVGALPDPGSLTAYRGQNGRRIAFQVTGRTNGSIWGSDTYTDDSDLGTAAVHAGLLKPGQAGIVQVTVLPGLSSYPGTHRNGVTTSAYAAWTGSYRLELVTLY